MEENKFPVLIMQMSDHALSVRLSDERGSQQVTFPKDMIDMIVERWQSFQRGQEPEKYIFGRYYTGSWSKEEMLL